MFTFLAIAATAAIALTVWASVAAFALAIVAGGRISWQMEKTAADIAALPTTKGRK